MSIFSDTTFPCLYHPIEKIKVLYLGGIYKRVVPVDPNDDDENGAATLEDIVDKDYLSQCIPSEFRQVLEMI